MATHRLTSASVLEPEEDLTRQMQEMQKVETQPEQKPKPWARLTSLSKGTKLKLKIAFSIVVFACLFFFGKIDLTKTWEVASRANPVYLAIAAALVVGSTFINAARWQVLARAVGLDRPLLPLVQYCFVGCFFNLFLPSTVGGDVSRCYYIAKGTGKHKAALYSVLADRVVGISVLFLLASGGLMFGPGASELLSWSMKVPIILGTLGIFIGIPLLPRLSQMVLGENHWISQRFRNSAFKVYWQDKKLIGLSLAQSIGLQVVLVAAHVLVGLSLGLTQVPVWYYCIFYPLVAVLGFVTPSFNGIGVREGAYTYFLVRPFTGVDNAHAFAFAMILLGLNTFLSLVGGLVYAAGHFKFSEEDVAELQHDVIEEPEDEN